MVKFSGPVEVSSRYLGVEDATRRTCFQISMLVENAMLFGLVTCEHQVLHMQRPQLAASGNKELKQYAPLPSYKNHGLMFQVISNYLHVCMTPG